LQRRDQAGEGSRIELEQNRLTGLELESCGDSAGTFLVVCSRHDESLYESAAQHQRGFDAADL